MMEGRNFGMVDYVLFAAVLIISALIGVYFGFFSKKKQNTVSEYLLGGKTMGIFPIAMSLAAGHVSGITLLGVPSEMYTYGTQYAVCGISACIVGVLICYIYLPVFHEIQLTSSYEYLERRFNSSIRKLASFLFALSLMLYLPIVIYVPAIAFSQVSGMDIHIVTFVLSLVCVFYTTIGGMRAVVWTDTLQSIITVGAMVVVVGLGASAVGGFGEVWQRANDGGRLIFFDMNPSPFVRTSYWAVSIGLTTMWLSNMAVSQTNVQRFMSLPTISDARKTVWVFVLLIMIIKAISILTGLTMYAKYYDCDPLSTGRVAKADQMLPNYVIDIAGHIPGLSGLFVAGVFSAGLSTMSAGLNTLAGTIYEDFFKPLMPKGTDKRASNIMKITVVVSGTLCFLLVFAVERLGSVMQLVISLNGVTTGSMLGMFSLGMLVPRANTKGVLSGAIVSILVVGWMIAGQQIAVAKKELRYTYLPLDTSGCDYPVNQTSQTVLGTYYDESHSEDDVTLFYRVAFMFYTLVGAALVFIVGIPVSYMTDDPGFISHELLSPIIRRWAPKDPKSEYKTVDQALIVIHTNGDIHK